MRSETRLPPKAQVVEEKALLGREAENRAKILWEESVRIRHVICGTLPCVKMTSLRQAAHLATNAFSDMLRRRRSPTRSQRNVVRKDQLLY